MQNSSCCNPKNKAVISHLKSWLLAGISPLAEDLGCCSRDETEFSRSSKSSGGQFVTDPVSYCMLQLWCFRYRDCSLVCSMASMLQSSCQNVMVNCHMPKCDSEYGCKVHAKMWWWLVQLWRRALEMNGSCEIVSTFANYKGNGSDVFIWMVPLRAERENKGVYYFFLLVIWLLALWDR